MNEEVVTTIDGVVKTLVRNLRVAYYTTEDMYQEAWVFALEALPQFDPSRGELHTFLRTHIRNRFINMHRDKVARHTSPCQKCVFHKGGGACTEFEDPHSCERWRGWQLRNMAKKSLAESGEGGGDTEKCVTSTGRTAHDIVADSELFHYISSRIPLEHRVNFRRLLEGASLPKQPREELQAVIREIICQLNENEDRQAPKKNSTSEKP